MDASLFVGAQHSQDYLSRLYARFAFQYERETGSALPELSLISSGHLTREAQAIESSFRSDHSAKRFVLAVAAAEFLSRVVTTCAEEFRVQGEQVRQSTTFRFMRIAAEAESLESFVVDVCRDVAAKSSELTARVDGLYLMAQEVYSSLGTFLLQVVPRQGGEVVGLSGLLGVLEMALLIQNQVLGEGERAEGDTISELLGIH